MKLIITIYHPELRQKIEAEKDKTHSSDYRRKTNWMQRQRDKMEEKMMEGLFSEKIISRDPLTLEMEQRHFKTAAGTMHQIYFKINDKFVEMGYTPDVDFNLKVQ